MQANIELHTQLADAYRTCEPHFRPENVAKVDAKLRGIVEQTKAKRLLDLGCGTGFMVHIAKAHVEHITGVDITPAMMEKIDTSGTCHIDLIQSDTGSVSLQPGSYDVATAYSFLHHLYDIRPTLTTAAGALRAGGVFYADLDPNYYFWEKIGELPRDGAYDTMVKREIEAVTYKDEDIKKNFGVNEETFNQAEYHKNIVGGFREELLRDMLQEAGFTNVDIFYHWYIGQGVLINDEQYTREDRFHQAEIIDRHLRKVLPLSKSLFKYIGFVAVKG